MKNLSLFHILRGGLPGPRTVAVASLLLGLLMFPGLCPAVDLTGASNTYLSSRENEDKLKILRAYEYLDVDVQNIGNETITFHAGGWLRYDLGDREAGGSRSNSDLQYSYLSFKGKTANTVVNVGRIMVFEGVAAERLDGLSARTDLAAGFGVSAFGGSPALTGQDGSNRNSVYGARLSHQTSDVYRLGVSALKEELDGKDFRKEAGVDLWLRPLSKAELAGRSSYNAITKDWMEYDYVLSLGPFGNLRLNTEASMINYKDYFAASTNRAFALQSGIIDPREKAGIVGEEAALTITDKLLITADYKSFSYDLAGKAASFGGKIRYGASGSGGAGAGYRRMEGESDRLRYSEYRIYGYKKFGKLDVAVDVIDVAYDAAIHGVTDAYAASLAALYELAGSWSLGADAEYAKNPDFNKDVRTFFKLMYRFGAKGGA